MEKVWGCLEWVYRALCCGQPDEESHDTEVGEVPNNMQQAPIPPTAHLVAFQMVPPPLTAEALAAAEEEATAAEKEEEEGGSGQDDDPTLLGLVSNIGDVWSASDGSGGRDELRDMFLNNGRVSLEVCYAGNRNLVPGSNTGGDSSVMFRSDGSAIPLPCMGEGAFDVRNKKDEDQNHTGPGQGIA